MTPVAAIFMTALCVLGILVVDNPRVPPAWRVVAGCLTLYWTLRLATNLLAQL